MNQLKMESTLTRDFQHLEMRYEPQCHAVWLRLKHPGRPCMSKPLLKEIAEAQQIIAQTARSGRQRADKDRLQYQVLSSNHGQVFSLGGDLAHFIEAVKTADRQALHDYAKACVDILYESATSYGIPFTTISLVQGEALGGGFEAALSSNVLIAERGATFGFPETVFGLFPGMGAFSFLARRVTPSIAKRIIASGKVYTAKELYEMGVVDVLVPEGQGNRAVCEYIQHQRNRSIGFHCLEKVAEQFNPLTYEELMDVAELWVDAAMQLTSKNLRLMQYLVEAQEQRWNKAAEKREALSCVLPVVGEKQPQSLQASGYLGL